MQHDGLTGLNVYDVRMYVIILMEGDVKVLFYSKHEVMVERHDNGSRHGNLKAEMPLCSLSVAYACPYHNPTSTMGHSVHHIRKPLAHMMPYMWSAICLVQLKP